MSDSGTFTKGGRIWAYEKFPSEKRIGVFYEANLQEATRVSNKYGENYTGNMNGKYYVLHSGYDLQPNGSWTYGTLPPGTETSNGNANQAVALAADVGLKQQITGSPNQTQQETPDQQGGSTPTTDPNQTQPASNQNTGESDAYLKYPILMNDDQDRIKFQALTYTSSPSRVPSQGFEVLPVAYSPIGPHVILPIQSSITDQNAVGWEPDTLNPIEKQAVGLSRRIMESGSTTDITGSVSSKLTEALQGLRVSHSEVRTYLTGQAVGVNNLLSRLNGKVLNPNLELLFQGPQLRPFNFTFKLSPRSKKEAEVVKKIIRYFKQNMAPIVGDQGLFLKTPNVFKIEYQYKASTTHSGINLIKECALVNCSVDYTPNGTYMTYPEGTMVSYTLNLQFQELEPVYSRDYEQGVGASHPIGY